MTGYPAFAVDNVELQQATEIKVKTTLAGEKGYKRFLRDSYLTVREGGREFKEPIGDTTVSRAYRGLIYHCGILDVVDVVQGASFTTVVFCVVGGPHLPLWYSVW